MKFVFVNSKSLQKFKFMFLFLSFGLLDSVPNTESCLVPSKELGGERVRGSQGGKGPGPRLLRHDARLLTRCPQAGGASREGLGDRGPPNSS